MAGKLFDYRGNRMSPSHAARGGRRWRYYVSQAIMQGLKQEAGTVTRVMFRLRIDANIVAEGLTAVQAHLLVGKILERTAVAEVGKTR